jgi:hypothetical protein
MQKRLMTGFDQNFSTLSTLVPQALQLPRRLCRKEEPSLDKGRRSATLKLARSPI